MLLSKSKLTFFLIFFGVLVSIDVLGLMGRSYYAMPIKYLYLIIIVFFISISLYKYRTVDSRTLAPFIAIAFFLITFGMFIFNFINLGYKTSYVSAFISALVFAAAAFIPTRIYIFDGKKILRILLALFTFGSIFYLIETILKTIGGTSFQGYYFYQDVEHVKSFLGVLAITLAILMGKYKVAIFVLAITIFSLILRPTSTLILALVICLPAVFALKVRAIVPVQIASALVLIGATALPFLLVYTDTVSNFAVEVESIVKSDLLGGVSNAEFRLYIIQEAFRELEQTSFIFGNGFTGDTNVFVAFKFPYWVGNTSSGLAAIHSDFVIIINQSGYVGYAFFILMLSSILFSRFRHLRKNKDLEPEIFNVVSISIIAGLLLILYSSFNPFLQQYHFLHFFWMLLFFSEMACKTNSTRV
ncbi:MAG: O-antigen ligase family protein [Proteobacteria bacterium]|nr:O-antigen ligase family protein [Pseudomonadota bacterium]